MSGFVVGARVTVKTTDTDPVHLVIHPHVLITRVVDGPAGPIYLVEHVDQPASFRPQAFGPYPANALELGW